MIQHLRLRAFCALLVLSSLALWGLQACEQPTPFDREAMLQSLAADVVIPSYQALAKDTKALATSSPALCATTTLAQLQETRKAWLQAKLAWKRSKIFRFGPAEALEAEAHIDYWPIKTNLIEKELSESTALNAAYVDQLGASRRGLATIEYLLYDTKQPGDDNAVLTALAATAQPNRRCAMLVALTDGVARRSQMLLEAWEKTPVNKRPPLFLSVINKDKASLTWQPAIDEIINEIVFGVQVLLDRQLGEPLGHKHGGTSQPDATEAPRSAQSLALIRASLEGVQRLYYGTMAPPKESDEKKGISALLAHNSPLVDKHMQRDLYSASVALTKLQGDSLVQALSAEKDAVENAWAVTKLLLTTLRVEVVGDLGVVLTFSDIDGD